MPRKQSPSSNFDANDIDRVIKANLPKLNKTGVLTVRPGFEITGDKLTGNPAVVATVHTKKAKSILPASAVLPDKLGKYNVDVREASPHQRLRAFDPATAALAHATGRPEEADPEWAFEREMPSGQYLSSKKSTAHKAFNQSQKTQTLTHRALSTVRGKQPIKYQPPKDAPALVRTQVTATITAVVSPDAGYATLSKFLAATTQSLVVGIYDFTSGSILKNFITDLSGKKLQMVLDHPAPNPTADQSDWQTQKELSSQLGANAKIAWALVRSDAFAAAWMFPYAYHIKVIVRDGKTVWLSSGNLNNSNEPNFAQPPHTEDRDWHLILESPELASIFTTYLDYDFAAASAHQAPNADDIERAIEEARAKNQKQATPTAKKPAPPVKNPVAPKTFSNVTLAVTPLLTPDTLPNGKPQYLSAILDLISKATKKIYIQLQYIESNKDDGGYYQKLLQALADKIAAGLDVRLIESKQYGLKWAEKMKAGGVDLTNNIQLQDNVHNKGFVIDSSIAVVSSQNFSPAGVQDNRDAGLILENSDIAQYFEKVFLSDWNFGSQPAATHIKPLSSTSPSKRANAKPAKTKSKVKR